ncbi:tripartite tricarboxylate transporter substrate binding protein [Variovorax defluvii]|uniref:Tripartite tricarboxylate transporter substrate binding protein n=1 Tax=Variovorax defluvii TaxID=913761 RepID=A0ABP8IE68_9BURK
MIEARRHLLKVAGAAFLGTMGSMMSAAWSQSRYPSKVIKTVVPFPPGTSPDAIARVWAHAMGRHLGGTIIIDNRPGATSVIGTQAVATAPADGYTLLYTVQNTFSINPFVFPSLPYKPSDFVPVSQICGVPMVLITGAGSGINSFQEMVQRARKRPESMNFASLGIGQSTHVAMVRLMRSIGIEMTHVPYKDGGVGDVMGGAVDVSFESSTVALPLIQAGKLRALAVSSATRLELLPEVYTLPELVPNFAAADSWQGLFVRNGTPSDVVATLVAASQSVTGSEEFQRRLRESSLIPVGNTPAEFAKVLEQESRAFQQLVRENNIRVQ